MRAINLIEKHELVNSNEKCRLLVAQANIEAGCTTQAISVLENKIDKLEIYGLDGS